MTIERTTILSLFILLSTLCFGEYPDSWAKIQKEEESPSRKIIVQHRVIYKDGIEDATHANYITSQIRLLDAKDRSKVLLVHENLWPGEIFFSPDEERLIINQDEGSARSVFVLFERTQDLHYERVNDFDLTLEIWKFFIKHNPLGSTYHHRDLQGIAWSRSGTAFLLKLRGYGDGDETGKSSAHTWYCIYDFNSRKASLDLGIFNQGAVDNPGKVEDSESISRTAD